MDLGEMQRACPVCNAQAKSAFWTKGQLRLARCRNCGMVYADPVGAELAGGAFYQRLAKPFYLSREKLESDYASVRYERELRLFRDYCRGGQVLDVGCSTGAFLYQLKNRWPGEYEPLGADVAGAALDYAASRGVAVTRESFLEYDPGQRKFAAVTFWAVMEHLAEPRRFLVKAAEVLRPGGHCFILVPNFGSLAVRLLGARYRYVMLEHVNYFNATTLRRLAGLEPRFRIARLSSTHFNPVVLWQDWRKPRARIADEDRARLLERTTGWKQNRWLWPLRVVYRGVEKTLGSLGLADNLVMVLQKGTE